MITKETENIAYYQAKIKEYVNDILGGGNDKYVWIRFPYSLMGCFGIDGNLTLLKANDSDVMVDECDDLSLLQEIKEMLRLGKYRLVEKWRCESDKNFFRAENYDIYTPHELYKNRDVYERIFKSIFESFHYMGDIEEHMIKYCWFDYMDCIINAPIMIDTKTVKIFVNSDIDVYQVFEWFRDNKSMISFHSISNIVRDDEHNPGYIEFNLLPGAIDALRKASEDRLFSFPIKVHNIY